MGEPATLSLWRLSPLTPTLEVSDRAWTAMISVAVKLGFITQADLDDQDDQNISDAFVERDKKGTDALTVRGEIWTAYQGTGEVS